MIAAESAGRAIKVPVATVAQTGFTIPSQSAGLPPPILIQVGDMVAYWGISGTTAGTFGAVALANLSAATASTTALAYAAAINALAAARLADWACLSLRLRQRAESNGCCPGWRLSGWRACSASRCAPWPPGWEPAGCAAGARAALPPNGRQRSNVSARGCASRAR